MARRQLPRDAGRFVAGVSYSPSTQFKPGQSANPQTAFRPGQRVSPATEFKPGQSARNKLPVGAITIRTFRGVQRAWVKVAEPNVWRERSKVVWERANGRPVPRGLVIHHRDHDSLNDAPDNLQALTRKQHALVHLADAQAAGFGSAESRQAAHEAKRSAC